MDPLELTLLEAATALRTRQLGHLEYVQALLAQTDRLNPLNAWISRDPERLIAQGKALDQTRPALQNPLAGIPVAIKDNICVAGVPMMNGTSVLEGYVPDVDATLVTRILDAGGEIAGKADCESLCFSGGSHTTDNGPVLNPGANVPAY